MKKDTSGRPFPMEEYQARLKKVRKAMEEPGVDVLMVNSPENIYYLTGYDTIGFYTFQALIIPKDEQPLMIVRQLETPNVWNQTWIERSIGYLDEENPIELAKETLIELGVSEGAIGIEKDCWWLTIEQYEELGSLLPKATFKNCSRLVDTIRLIKSEREVEYIRQAAKIIDKGMSTGIEAIEEGRTDTDVAIAIDNTLKAEGSEYLECPILVGSGPGSACPHTTYVGRKLEKGDVFLLEAAAVVRRYHAALLRCAVLGEPSKRQRQAGEAVLKGLSAALDMMKPGIPAGEVDRASREIVREAGFEAGFDHRTGYHIGIAFAPNWVEHGFSINVGVPDILQSGMVFHLLASLFIPGLGGFGGSETVLVTEDGCEPLTKLPRKLFIK